MIFLMLLRSAAVVCELFLRPVPAHVPTEPCRPGAAAVEGGVTGGPSLSAQPVARPVPWPVVEDAPGWVAHPKWRVELHDESLAYLLGIWAKEATR